jgi:predicted DNA binding CopG/RHH family protein
MRQAMTKATGVPKTIPAFQTEDEEIEFWDTHDPDDYFEAEPLDDLIVAIKPQPKKAVTLRMDADLLARLKEVAAQHHIGYQTLARELLRHALSGGTPRGAGAKGDAKPRRSKSA